MAPGLMGRNMESVRKITYSKSYLIETDMMTRNDDFNGFVYV